MPQKQLAELARRAKGKPILVIGGGPSGASDLRRQVVKAQFIISCNEHAFLLAGRADLIVSVDDIHQREERPMRDVLTKFSVPVCAPFGWADYEFPDCVATGNSGLAAAGIACLLGGAPIYVAGMDTLENERHLKPIKALFGSREIRPISGPWRDAFKR